MKFFYLDTKRTIRIFFTALLLLTGSYGSYAQSPTVSINPGFTHALCGDSTVAIPFITTGSFNPGNVFSIELSNEFGVFTIPDTLGKDTTTTSGAIVWNIPSSISLSNNYRIRVSSTSPSYVSAEDSISISHAPSILDVTNNGPICSGDTLKLSITVNSIDTANTFKWVGPAGYTSNVHNPVIDSADTTRNGTYNVLVTAFGCASATYSTTVVVTRSAIPSIIISPGPTDTICAGTTVNFGTVTGGAGSTPGFQWYKNNLSISGATSSVYSTSVLSNNDTIKVIMVSNAVCRTAPSANSKTRMVVKPVPATPIGTNSGPVCNTDAVAFTGNCTTAGVSYKWTGPEGFTSALQNPTISHTDTGSKGIYVLTATLNGCTSRADSDTLVVLPSVIPDVSFTTGVFDTVCSGDMFTFTTTTTNAGSSPSFLWKKNGSVIIGVTTPGYTTDSLKDGDGISCIMMSSANCPRPASVSFGALVTVKPLPSVINVLSNSPLCSGDTLNLNATASIFSCTFLWTGPAGFTSTLSNPKIVMDTMHAGNYIVKAILNGCASAPYIVPVAVTQSVTPSVAISVWPGTVLLPNGSVRFTATFSNGGSAPALQWKKNGFNIPGATDNTYSTSSLSDSDVISVSLTSNATCATPPVVASNHILMRVSRPAVIDKTDLVFYPNPTSGKFIIKGTDTSVTNISISIYSSVGQRVYKSETTVTQGFVYLPIDISGVADGVYIMRVKTNTQKYSVPITVKH